MNDVNEKLEQVALSPEGPYRVGDIVSASWTFRNTTSEIMSGKRLQVGLSEGLAPLLDYTSVRGIDYEKLDTLFGTANIEGDISGNGVDIPDILPGDIISCNFAVKIGKVSTRDKLWVKALVLSKEETDKSQETPIEVILSPFLSVGRIENLTFKGENSVFGIRFEITNEGGRAAEDIRIEIPLPVGVDPHENLTKPDIKAVYDEPRRKIIISPKSIAAYGHTDIGLRLQTNNNLVNDIVEISDVSVHCPDYGTLYLAPSTFRVEKLVDLTKSNIEIAQGWELEAGSIVDVVVHIRNTGRSAAKSTNLAVVLPEELQYATGTLRIDGTPDSRRNSLSRILIQSIQARSEIDISFKATVISPIENNSRFDINASLDNVALNKYEFVVKSAPAFGKSSNDIITEGPAIIDGLAERRIFIKASNSGTDIAKNVRVILTSTSISFAGAVVITEEDGKTETNIQKDNGRQIVIVGDIPPQERRIISIYAGAEPEHKSGTEFHIKCEIEADLLNASTIGELTLIKHATPVLSHESALVLLDNEPVKAGSTKNLIVRVRNDGYEDAKDVSIRLELPGGISVESIKNAVLEKENILIVDRISSRTTRDIFVNLQVNSVVSGESESEIRATASTERTSTIKLIPVTIHTSALPFIDEVRVDIEAPDLDGMVTVRLWLSNVGDGNTRSTVIFCERPIGYAKASTMIDGAFVADVDGSSPLEHGLALPSLAPGNSLNIAFRTAANPETAWTPRFTIQSEDQEDILEEGRTLRPTLKSRAGQRPPVRSRETIQVATPVIPNATPVSRRVEVLPFVDEANITSVLSNPIENAIAADSTPAIIVESTTQSVKVKEEVSPAVAHVESITQTPVQQQNEETTQTSTPKNVISEQIAQAKSPQEANSISADDEDQVTFTSVKSSVNNDVADDDDIAVPIPTKKVLNKEDYDDDEVIVVATTLKNQKVQNDDDDDIKPVEILSKKMKVADDDDDGIQNVPIKSRLEPRKTALLEPGIEFQPLASEILGNGDGATRRVKLDGPTVVLSLDKNKRDKILSTIDTLNKTELGWYRHVFAMRMLVPDKIYAVDTALETQWEIIVEDIKQNFRVPFLRLAMPHFKPNPEWSEKLNSPKSLKAMEIIMHRMPVILTSEPVNYPTPKFATTDVFGTVNIKGTFVDYFEPNEKATEHHINALLPELLPDTSNTYEELGKVLQEYKRELIPAFKQIVYMEKDHRHKRMMTAPRENLDRALMNVYTVIKNNVK